MKRRFWKIEYSITIFVIFGIVLLLIPTSFITPKEAGYITKWNETYNKIDYMFTAMSAQADAKIVNNLNKAKTNEDREALMLRLVKPYLRIQESDVLTKKYNQHYMNGNRVNQNDDYYFEKVYLSDNGIIVGIKDIKDEDVYHPCFIMLFDVNGLKGPNKWGKDIYGINIFKDGKITPIGYGWDINKIKQDCSEDGSGLSCSYYYRIGGEFNEG